LYHERFRDSEIASGRAEQRLGGFRALGSRSRSQGHRCALSAVLRDPMQRIDEIAPQSRQEESFRKRLWRTRIFEKPVLHPTTTAADHETAIMSQTTDSTGAVRYELRRALDPTALDALFRAAWGEAKPGYERALERSFTWVTATAGQDLVGFVNVAWDGDVHFFLLDTTVHPDWRGKGIARRLVEEAIAACRGRGEWLHVDAPEELMDRLYRPIGFEPTPAGLIRLK
jgi:GNAT superfamily N-acetyltransferase